VRIPTFSRQSEPDTAEADRPATAGSVTAPDPADRPAPVRPRRDSDDDTTTTDLRTTRPAPLRTDDLPPATRPADRHNVTPPPPPPAVTRKPDADDTAVTERTPVVAGPRPRASLLATLGLILGVAALMLVLSGPLLGWGIGVAVLALILSLSGIHATGKRHVAGKSDALLGMVFSLGAIVLGVLALTGSLAWLGTDMQPVSSAREWLDSHVINRF